MDNGSNTSSNDTSSNDTSSNDTGNQGSNSGDTCPATGCDTGWEFY